MRFIGIKFSATTSGMKRYLFESCVRKLGVDAVFVRRSLCRNELDAKVIDNAL